MKDSASAPIIKRSVVTREELTYEFTDRQVLDALCKAGLLPNGAETGAYAWVDVPGGGDWSNTALDLEEHPLKVRVVRETRTP